MKKIIFLATFLILIGAGCASPNQQKPAAPSPATTSTPTVIKKPATENKNPVYDFCEKNQNEIIIRFDQGTQSSKAYCRFLDTSECAAEEYFAGNCAPGKGNKIFIVDTSAVNASETCAQNYEPVCGEDKITYTNECVARMQGIKITKTGVCPPPPLLFPPVNPGAINLPDGAPAQVAEEPDWLDIVKNFILSQPAESPRAHLDRCYYSGSVVYLKASGCAGCYDSLYDRDGKIICYPNHDFSDSCPSFSTATANCARVWTDSR